MMDGEPNQPAPRRMPGWSRPAGLGLRVITVTAMVSAILATVLFMVCPLVVCRDLTPGPEANVGLLVILALWGGYLLALPLHDARRFQPARAIAVTALGATAVVLAACALSDEDVVGTGLFFGALSHGTLLIATVSARHCSRLVDADHWVRWRLSRGLCPQCGYDIRALPQQRCPECGTTWSAEETSGEAGETLPPPRLR